MKIVYEHDIIQNSAIASLALRNFCLAYYDAKNKEHGPPMPLVMPILPIAFNEYMVTKLYSRNFDGGLFKAVTEDATLFTPLQKNMESMYPQTFQALNICFSTGMLNYNRETAELLPKKTRTRVQTVSTQMFAGFKRIEATTTRLGYWFAKLRTEHILTILNIRF